MSSPPRFCFRHSGQTTLATALTPIKKFLAVVFPGIRPCLLTAAAAFFLQTSLFAAPPAYLPTDAEFQKDAKWLRSYTAGLVDTNRAIYKDGRTAFLIDRNLATKEQE